MICCLSRKHKNFVLFGENTQFLSVTQWIMTQSTILEDILRPVHTVRFFLIATAIPSIAANGLHRTQWMCSHCANATTSPTPMQPIVSKNKSQPPIAQCERALTCGVCNSETIVTKVLKDNFRSWEIGYFTVFSKVCSDYLTVPETDSVHVNRPLFAGLIKRGYNRKIVTSAFCSFYGYPKYYLTLCLCLSFSYSHQSLLCFSHCYVSLLLLNIRRNKYCLHLSF